MYSAHKIDCLKQLGVTLLAPKVADTSIEQTPQASQMSPASQVLNTPEATQSISLIPEPLLLDLRVLFPNLLVEEPKCQLSSEFTWRIQPGATRFIVTSTQIITTSYAEMTTAQKRDFWANIQAHTPVMNEASAE